MVPMTTPASTTPAAAQTPPQAPVPQSDRGPGLAPWKARWSFVAIAVAAIAIIAGSLIVRSLHSVGSTIAGSGTIEAIQVDIASKVSGRIQSLLVHDGDRVKTGEAVARIDPADARLALSQARADLDAAKAHLSLAQASFALQRDVNASGIGQARAQVAASAAHVPQAIVLSGIEAQSVSSQIDAADANVRAAAAALDTSRATLAAADADVTSAQAAAQLAQATFKRNDQLFRAGDISALAYDQSRTAARTARDQAKATISRRDALAKQVIAAEANLRAAHANLDIAIASEQTVAVKQLDVTASSAQLEQSKAFLAGALAQTHALDQRQADVAAARAEVEQAQAAVGLAQRQFDETTLRAPFDGIVLSHSAEIGDLVVPQTPVITVADIDHPYLDVFVGETDLARVKIGQTVDVSVDGAPGRIFKGRVTSVGTKAEFTPSNVQTKEQRAELVFRVRIDLPNTDGTLKPGLPADGLIDAGG